MKVKVYRVVPKKNPNEYIDFLSAKDMIAERFKVKGGEE